MAPTTASLSSRGSCEAVARICSCTLFRRLGSTGNVISRISSMRRLVVGHLVVRLGAVPSLIHVVAVNRFDQFFQPPLQPGAVGQLIGRGQQNVQRAVELPAGILGRPSNAASRRQTGRRPS